MNQPPVTHTRIGTLRLRIPAADAASAKRVALEVASKLALRTGELQPRDSMSITVTAPPSGSALAGSMVDTLLGTKGRRR